MAQESYGPSVRKRLLTEMLQGVSDSYGGGYKVLIMDELTTKVASTAAHMSDILECGVSVVEDLNKGREPLNMPAVYFIEPTAAAVTRLISDFGKAPLYPSLHVFFSSKVTADTVERLKRCPPLMQRLRTLKEVNLEFLTVDSRTVSTGHPEALVRLFGENVESSASAEYASEIDSITSRLATLFSTLGDFPAIRFKVGRPPEVGDPLGQNSRTLLTQRIATKLSEKLMVMQRSGTLPARETADLLVLDRSIDPVAPVIHEWTYEPLVYDLLNLTENVVTVTSETQAGRSEAKPHFLDERDSLWVELRHAHIADVYTTLYKRFSDFQAKNKAAKYAGGKSGAADSSSSVIRSLIAALPQYRDTLTQLSLHISLSSDVKNKTNSRNLTAVGELEQDLVYGDKTSKDLIGFLAENALSLETQDKVRLFVCYLATHPEKLDATKRSQWQKLARLTAEDMNTVTNLAYLGVAIMKLPTPGIPKSLNFAAKKKKAVRNERKHGESAYSLSRFDPLLLDILEDAAASKLSVEEFPYIRPPQQDELFPEQVTASSARTNRTGINWAKRATGTGSETGSAATKRLVVFVAGGVSRSEMRVVHQLSRDLHRDIILVSTSVESPSTFLDQLAKLNSVDLVPHEQATAGW